MTEEYLSLLRLSPSVWATVAWGTMLAQGLKFNKKVFFGRSLSLFGVYVGTSLVVDGAFLVAERWQEASRVVCPD